MTSDRPLPTHGPWLRVAMPYPEELSEKDGQGWGVGYCDQAGTPAPWVHCTVDFEGQEVSGPESLGPALTLASVDFWSHLQGPGQQ